MLLFLHRDHKSKTNGSCLQMYRDECSYSARYRPTLSAPGFKKGIFLKKKKFMSNFSKLLTCCYTRLTILKARLRYSHILNRKIKNLGKVLF